MHEVVPKEFFAATRTNLLPRRTTPEEAAILLQTKPGMIAQVVAAEPHMVTPVAIDFGTDGRLWVAEMRDYPLGMDGKLKPGGRINVRTDTNGDGSYEHRRHTRIPLPDHRDPRSQRPIEPRYTGYTVTLKDRRSLAGVISEESGNSFTLLQPGHVSQRVLRSDVATMSALDTSFMPEGLEGAASIQAMAGLIAPCAARRYIRRRPRPDGLPVKPVRSACRCRRGAPTPRELARGLWKRG